MQVWFATSGTSGKAFGISADVVAPDRVRVSFSPPSELNAAVGDIFRVQRGTDDKLWVQEKLEASGCCAIRVAPASDSPLGAGDAGANAILARFAAIGVSSSDWLGLIVIDVAPDAQLDLVRAPLDTGQRSGWWHYHELCVTDAWRDCGYRLIDIQPAAVPDYYEPVRHQTAANFSANHAGEPNITPQRADRGYLFH